MTTNPTAEKAKIAVKISEDMKAAMKAGEKEKLNAIRMLHAAIRKKRN